jgi:hypothetical protein
MSAACGWSGSPLPGLRLFFGFSFRAVLGLYDQRGMLRYAGPGRAECLAYAELFDLPEESFCLEPLFAVSLPGELPGYAVAEALALS